MRYRTVILLNPDQIDKDDINWHEIGYVVSELSQLYHLARENRIDLILVDESRKDLKRAVTNKIRRYHGLTEIWIIADREIQLDQANEYIDGLILREMGQDGIARKVDQILKSKDLLERMQLVGRSSRLKVVSQTIERIAPTDISVLVVGPSGSGKELVARALHKNSSRRDNPFIEINCGALAEGVLESELFGHEKGAFTGSVTSREGLFHKADKGTIFLDEIGETKSDMQVKLLRVLEEKVVERVGDLSLIHI